mmetsp:Transcript_43295/g.101071  ORF Transcript_43295/g.101071 Transcript_43295/m.101071 type:complete len:210 (+) Transcript_43295:249-878(+)
MIGARGRPKPFFRCGQTGRGRARLNSKKFKKSRIMETHRLPMVFLKLRSNVAATRQKKAGKDVGELKTLEPQRTKPYHFFTSSRPSRRCCRTSELRDASALLLKYPQSPNFKPCQVIVPSSFLCHSGSAFASISASAAALRGFASSSSTSSSLASGSRCASSSALSFSSAFSSTSFSFIVSPIASMPSSLETQLFVMSDPACINAMAER